MSDYEDEDDFLDSAEGERWLENMERATEGLAQSLRNMHAAFLNVGLLAADIIHEQRAEIAGVSAAITRDLLKRVSGDQS